MPPLFPNVWGTPAFVLDVSVPLRWLMTARGNRYTSGVLSKVSSNTVAVPASWPTYFTECVRREEEAGRVSEARANRFLTHFRAFSISVDPSGDERAWDASLRIARSHLLFVQEADLLELAQRLNLPLATDEPDLLAAANALAIPIYQP
jgi:predicted nucleic acid-binding protein